MSMSSNVTISSPKRLWEVRDETPLFSNPTAVARVNGQYAASETAKYHAGKAVQHLFEMVTPDLTSNLHHYYAHEAGPFAALAGFIGDIVEVPIQGAMAVFHTAAAVSHGVAAIFE